MLKTILMGLVFAAHMEMFFGGVVNCTNSGSDPGAIQSALNGGGTTTINGTCAIGSTTLSTASDGTTIQGGGGTVILNYIGSGFLLNLNHNNVNITGLIFNGGGIHTTQNSWYVPQSNVNITFNTIRNITMASGNNVAIVGDGYWSFFNISNNVFDTLTSVPEASISTSTNVENCSAPNHCTSDNYPCSWSGGTNNCYGSGIGNVNGLDNTTIQNNTFNLILGNAMSLKFDWTIDSVSGGFTRADNNNWSYNKFTKIHRMIEESGGGGNSCPPGSGGSIGNGCVYPNTNKITNWKIAGNYGTFIAAYGDTYGLSIPQNAAAPLIINNSFPITVCCGPGYGFEEGNQEEVFQGNTSGVNSGLNTWGAYNITAIQASGHTVFQQNNYFAGNITCGGCQYYGLEGNNYGGTTTNRYNVNASACDIPSNCAASNLSTGSSAITQSGNTASMSAYAIDQISIKWVQFFLDGSTTASKLQELQDLNSNFTSDRKWLYSINFSTSGLAGGTHTMVAKATDVSGATSTTSQNFTIGGGSGFPIANWDKTTLSFPVTAVGSTSASQVSTMTNSGTAAMTISSVPSLAGANPGDFTISTTCGSTLAAGASCTATVAFRPIVTGARTATVTISDNASGSPHIIMLSGGIPPCIGAGNIISNCNFINGTTGWQFNAGSLATGTVDNSGPNGQTAFHISVTSPVPSGQNIELVQSGLTVPPNGTWVQAAFVLNTTRIQVPNILLQDCTTFNNFGLMYQPQLLPGNLSTYLHYVTPPFQIVGSPSGSNGCLALQFDNAAAADQIRLTNVQVIPVLGSLRVSSGIVDNISHSIARLNLASSLPMAGNAGFVGRVRAVAAPNVCFQNTTGIITPQEIGPMFSTVSPPGTQFSFNVGGLTAGVGWNLCPELSNDNGTTWTATASVPIITAPLPTAQHPVLPVSPAGVDLSTTGTDFVYNLAADCSDIGTAYAGAIARQATQGTQILIPAGTHCGTVAAGGNFYFSTPPVDVVSFQSSAVDLATNSIALGGPASSVNPGDQVRFDFHYKALQVFPASTSCEFNQGIQAGVPYTVGTVINASTNKVSFICQNGTPIVFTTQGTDGGFSFNWVKTNRSVNGHKITLRSAVPDNQLPPPRVLITPTWQSKMAYLESNINNLGVLGPNGTVLTFTNNDGNVGNLPSDITIGPGIEITTVDSAEAHTSSDPNSWRTLIYIPQGASNITLDRVYVHPQPTPNRNTNTMVLDGYKTAVLNSYMDNGTFFHASNSTVSTKSSSTLITVAAGNVTTGSTAINSPARTISISGSTSGTEILYGYDMTNSNAFTVIVPSGLTATCNPSCLNKAIVGTPTGTCFHRSDPVSGTPKDAWPYNSSGDSTFGESGCAIISGNTVSSVIQAHPELTIYNPEGSQYITAGNGPGPQLWFGNYIACAGICLHVDDSGAENIIRTDYDFQANYFYGDFKWMYDPAHPENNPLSDKNLYYMRQLFETKSLRRERFKGNILNGNWNEVEQSSFALSTSVHGEGITDMDIFSNTFIHGPSVVSLPFVTAGSNYYQTPPVIRTRIQNNIAYDIGNQKFFAGSQAGHPGGYVAEGPNANEDITFSHNTIVGNVGLVPSVFNMFDTYTEGVSVTDNIFFIDGSTQGLHIDGAEPSFAPCLGKNGKTLADCAFTGTNGYVWQNNLMITNGQTPAAAAAAWSGLTNYFQLTGTPGLSTVGWNSYAPPPTLPANTPLTLDLRLSSKSPWNAAAAGVNNHGSPVGADVDQLEIDQKILHLIGVDPSTISSTSGIVAYKAPDSAAACWVDYATEPTVVVNPNRIQDTPGDRNRRTSITGLTTKTVYFYRVMCPGGLKAQDTGSFRTR